MKITVGVIAWTAPGGPSGGMGICKVGFYRQKNTPVVIYCADAVSVSDPDAVGIINPESDGADRHTYGTDPARSIFNFSCIHYAPLFFPGFQQISLRLQRWMEQNEWQIFLYIGIPLGMSWDYVSYCAGFSGILESDRTGGLFFLRSDDLKPLSLFISTITRDNVGGSVCGGFTAMLPPLLVFLCGRRYLEQGIAAMTAKD